MQIDGARTKHNNYALLNWYHSVCPLSVRSNGHFPGGPGLAGTKMSPFWIILELRMMAVVVTTGAIRSAKLQSSCYHQQTNTQLFTGRMPFLSPNGTTTLH